MRRKTVTSTARADLQQNYAYLAERTPTAAAAYYRMALDTFEHFPDDFRIPPKASNLLPEHVRVLYLATPFRGYTLWVAFYDEALYLIAAFSPGLPDKYKDTRALRGLSSLD